MEDSTERPWSDLPRELLTIIANYLTSNPNLLHTLSFRSVCNSWRSSCPLPSYSSILSPLSPLHTYPFFYRPHSILSVTLIYLLRRPLESSSIPYSWILFVDEFEPGKLKIRRPFSKWSYSLPTFFPKRLNLFDFDVHEIGRFYNLSYCDYYNDRLGIQVTKPQFHSEDVLKVVLFPNGLAAVALFQGGKLGLTRLGVEIYEGEWDVIHDGKGFRFDDIVDYKGRILGVDRRGRVYAIGHSSSELNPIVRSIARGDGRRNRLVESLGLLYLVVRCNAGGVTNGAASFKVYELNEKRRKWVEIDSIGDRVFFFGLEFSLSVSAQELYYRKNCILFKQHSFQSYQGEVDDNAEFSSSKSHDLYGVCHLDAPAYVGAIELYFGYSDTFWPPPAWIWPINGLERLRTVDAAIDGTILRIPESIETKFQDLTIERAGVSCDDLQQTGLEFRRFADRFKGTLNRGIMIEQELMDVEKKLQAWSMNGLSVSIDMLDQLQPQMERYFVWAQTAGQRLKTEEMHGGHRELQGAIEPSNIGHLSREIMRYMFGKHSALIFECEGFATDFREFVCYYNSLLNQWGILVGLGSGATPPES